MKSHGAFDGNDVCFPDRACPAWGGRPRPVVDPAGRVWPSLSSAARAYRLTHAAILHRATLGLAGWRLVPHSGEHQ